MQQEAPLIFNLFFLEMIISTLSSETLESHPVFPPLLFLKLPRPLFTAASQVGFVQSRPLEPAVALKRRCTEKLASPCPSGELSCLQGNSV